MCCFYFFVCLSFFMARWCDEGENWEWERWWRRGEGENWEWERWCRRGELEGLEEAGSFVAALGAFRAVVGNDVVWELPLWAMLVCLLVVPLGAVVRPLWAMLVCLLVPLGAVVRIGLGVVLVYVLFVSELERHASEENDAGG